MINASRRRMKKLTQFNIMVVGHSGVGKSTFIRTLMSGTGFPQEREEAKREAQDESKTLSIVQRSAEINLHGRKISVTVTDTPGFGDSVDNSGNCDMIYDHVQQMFLRFLEEEEKIERDLKFLDPRIHVVLYFLPPTIPFLWELDEDFMNKLGRAVNIIPVIGKADTLSSEELSQFKKKLVAEIEKKNLNVYRFPIMTEDEDNIIKLNIQLEDMLPFALVGSDHRYEKDGQQILARKYPWGMVEVENTEHSDFMALKEVLFKTHLEDLKDETHEVLYEFFRKNYKIQKDEGRSDKLVEKKKTLLEKKQVEEEQQKEKKKKIKIISFIS